MSEKRFTFKCNDNNCSIFDNGVWLKIEEIVDELNSLSDIVLAYDKTVAGLRKENKRLKRENEELEKRLSLYSEDNTTTNKRKVIPLGMRHREC